MTTLKERVEIQEKTIKEIKEKNELLEKSLITLQKTLIEEKKEAKELVCPIEDQRLEKISDIENEIEELKQKNEKLESDLSDLDDKSVKKEGMPQAFIDICNLLEDELGVNTALIKRKIKE